MALPCGGGLEGRIRVHAGWHFPVYIELLSDTPVNDWDVPRSVQISLQHKVAYHQSEVQEAGPGKIPLTMPRTCSVEIIPGKHPGNHSSSAASFGIIIGTMNN